MSFDPFSFYVSYSLYSLSFRFIARSASRNRSVDDKLSSVCDKRDLAQFLFSRAPGHPSGVSEARVEVQPTTERRKGREGVRFLRERSRESRGPRINVSAPAPPATTDINNADRTRKRG